MPAGVTCVALFVGRIAGRDKEHLVEAGSLAGALRRDQVAHVNRVECASHDAQTPRFHPRSPSTHLPVTRESDRRRGSRTWSMSARAGPSVPERATSAC